MNSPTPLLFVELRDMRVVYPLSSGPSGVARHHVAIETGSLRLNSGERVGIIGRNGAGKSTLLRIIAGLESPTHGMAVVQGRVTAVLTLGIGLRDDLSGRENVWIDGRLRGVEDAEIRAAFDEIVSFAELGDFIDRPVRTYSTGMKARLGFAMISQLRPEILLIDEALSVGDASFSAKATERIREICARGKLVVVVSHSMQSIRDICDRCIWIDGGRVVMDGPAQEVTRKYEEAVRSADESLLEAQFVRSERRGSRVAGWAVEGLSIRDPTSGGAVRLIASGSNVLVVCHVHRLDLSATRVQLRIVRMDELLIFERDFSIETGTSPIAVTWELKPLTLWIGRYRLEVLALPPSDDCALASASYLFEVFSPESLVGGRPLIRPRIFGESHRRNSEHLS